MNAPSSFVWRGVRRNWTSPRTDFWFKRRRPAPRRPAVWVSEAHHSALKQFAHERGISIAQALRRALRGRV